MTEVAIADVRSSQMTNLFLAQQVDPVILSIMPACFAACHQLPDSHHCYCKIFSICQRTATSPALQHLALSKAVCLTHVQRGLQCFPVSRQLSLCCDDRMRVADKPNRLGIPHFHDMAGTDGSKLAILGQAKRSAAVYGWNIHVPHRQHLLDTRGCGVGSEGLNNNKHVLIII